MNIKVFNRAKTSAPQTYTTNDSTMTQDQDTRRFDLVSFVAGKAQNFMFGNGTTIIGDKIAIKPITDIWNRNSIEMLLNQTEFNISSREDGNQILYVQPDIEGNVRVGLVDMDANSSVITDQYGNILSGMTTIMGTYGMLQFRIIQMWGPHRMTSTVEFSNQDGTYTPFNPASEEELKKYNTLPLAYKFMKE